MRPQPDGERNQARMTWERDTIIGCASAPPGYPGARAGRAARARRPCRGGAAVNDIGERERIALGHEAIRFARDHAVQEEPPRRPLVTHDVTDADSTFRCRRDERDITVPEKRQHASTAGLDPQALASPQRLGASSSAGRMLVTFLNAASLRSSMEDDRTRDPRLKRPKRSPPSAPQGGRTKKEPRARFSSGPGFAWRRRSAESPLYGSVVLHVPKLCTDCISLRPPRRSSSWVRVPGWLPRRMRLEEIGRRAANRRGSATVGRTVVEPQPRCAGILATPGTRVTDEQLDAQRVARRERLPFRDRPEQVLVPLEHSLLTVRACCALAGRKFRNGRDERTASARAAGKETNGDQGFRSR